MKKFVAWLLVLCLLVGVMPTVAWAGGYEEYCGNNAIWSFDTTTGILTISGTGNMWNYTANGDVPWEGFKNEIKSVVLDQGIASIGDYAFYECFSLTSITIPESVTSIGRRAFSDCTSLTSIAIPEGVTSIGVRAFSGCSGLTEIWIDENNPNYSSDASGILFDKEKTIIIKAPEALSGAYTIPDSVTSIGEYAFEYCSLLTSITIPVRVTSIGSFSFSDCSSLTVITLPEGVTSIGGSAFDGCSSLTSITLPEGVTSIGAQAFRGCSSLTSVIIPESVTSIGEDAFWGCGSLTGIRVAKNNQNYSSDDQGVLFNKDKTTLIKAPEALSGAYTIPDSVTNIDYSAFQFCFSLTRITIGSGITSIGADAFCFCSGLKSITIPEGVTSIGNSAFAHCSSLTDIAIPANVTSIGSWAFYGCYSIQNITIPANVIELGEYAFDSCNRLSKIKFGGDAPVIGEGAFNYVTATAYYPEVNATWTADVMQDYSGTITWVPYAEGTTPWEDEQPTEPVENPFTDVPSDKYYYDPILWAYENGITAGTSATAFSPDQDCTRGQIVTFLWRAAGCPEPTSTHNPFTDVDSDDYFYKAVLWAVENGITAGATKTTFNPKGACDRAQVVTFMWRAAGKPTPTSTKNPFVDVAAGKYYHDAVLWAVENGITSGISATKFAPNNTCTRGQIVTFLYRGYAN